MTDANYLRGKPEGLYDQPTPSAKSQEDIGGLSESKQKVHIMKVQGDTAPSSPAAANLSNPVRTTSSSLLGPLVAPSILEQAKQMALDEENTDEDSSRDDAVDDDDDQPQNGDDDQQDGAFDYPDLPGEDGDDMDDDSAGAMAQDQDEDDDIVTEEYEADEEVEYEDDNVVDDDNDGTASIDYKDSEPQKYDYLAKAKGQDGPPYLPKEVVTTHTSSAPEQIADPVVVPAVPSAPAVDNMALEKEITKSSAMIAPPPVMSQEEEEEDISNTPIIPAKTEKVVPSPNKAKDAIEDVIVKDQPHPGIIHVPQLPKALDEAAEQQQKDEEEDIDFVDTATVDKAVGQHGHDEKGEAAEMQKGMSKGGGGGGAMRGHEHAGKNKGRDRPSSAESETSLSPSHQDDEKRGNGGGGKHMHKGKHGGKYEHAKGDAGELMTNIVTQEEEAAAGDDIDEEVTEEEEEAEPQSVSGDDIDDSHDDDDDDRVSTHEKQAAVESASLTRNSAKENKKAPYVEDDSTDAICDNAASISTKVRCKTTAMIKYHSFALTALTLLILALLYYRRKRRASAGRRSRRFGAKSHEYARIVAEYDDLEGGAFDDDISYNDDNETLSTWSDGDKPSLEMSNFRHISGSDDRLGMHEMNG